MRPPEVPDTNDDSLRAPEPVVRREPQLVIALECDNPRAGAARFSLTGVREIRLGRGSHREARRDTDHGYTTLCVHLPGRSMSSSHARMVRAQGQWVLEDAGSRNGSFVNGQRITRAVVGDEDIAEVGHALLLVRESLSMCDGPSDLDSADLGSEPHGFRTIVPRIAEELDVLKRLAPTRVPILLLGETGTGKEAIAHGLHALSGRAGPIVPINCGALTVSLVEAQLFGHVRGAFSGAVRDELGFVRSAHCGTLFLDEVGELPGSSQATLLRVLQDGEVIPVGTTRPSNVDVRVVSATQRPLAADGAGFRADLLSRLAGRTFRLPPLRERIEDLGLAIAYVLETRAPRGGDGVTLTPELGRMFLRHRWPLNFRELQQALCASLPLADDGVLRCKHFPGLAPAETPPSPPTPLAGGLGGASVRDEDERLRIVLLSHLREQRGNVAAAARAMGKAPMQIHRWMKRFKIDPRGFRKERDA